MTRIEKYTFEDGEVALVYPECPYFVPVSAYSNEGNYNGHCNHPLNDCIFCSTNNAPEIMCCPFDPKVDGEL